LKTQGLSRKVIALNKDYNKNNIREGRLWSIDSRCPKCGEKFIITEYFYDLPIVGKVIISSGKCGKCGYTYKDIRAAESHGPQRIKLYVNSLEDLNTIVVRAGTASIYIPELGVSITPGSASQGFITTIEGILIRVKRIMEMLKDDPDIDLNTWKSRMENIKKAMVGELNFTLIIEDPEGVSRIISEKVMKEILYKS